MLRSLNSGVSGIQQFQEQMDVIGNNIANVNTTAFKSARVEFADAFSQTLRGSAAGSATSSSTTSLQVGTGVSTSSIQNQFTQGAVTRTGLPTDLAVSGQGFFVVRDPMNNSTFATRAGDFRVDNNGYLVTNDGMRVQGFSDAGLSARGDIQIDATGAPATAAAGATVASFSFDQQGQVNVRLSDGTEFIRGQVLLQNFQDPQALVKEGNNLYSGLSAAGPLTNPDVPGTMGLGRVQAGALELSNVDLANEFSTLITTQRAFQACSRIITTSDEMLQELVNLKR
ncbi:MAG TPA: flagellar hook-basal body complex protein [Candidatus Limnocylindria bacterium]|nr:flagellar hook-basal body complex protein [Candidatus Limnocylindria bacterium]